LEQTWLSPVRPLRRLIFLLSIALAVPAPLLAQTLVAQKQDERDVKARELFGIGKYAEALDLFGKLYADTSHPTYLRNVGRCYQNLGRPDEAIASFREYLRQVKNLSADQRAVVDGYIHEMEDLKKHQTEKSAAAEAAPAPALAPSPPIASARTPDSSVKAAAPGNGPEKAPADAGEPGAHRTVSYVVGGASLLALGVGGVFGLDAISNKDSGHRQCPMDPCSDAGLAAYNSAKTDARLADVFIGAGLVGAGVAAYLFFTSGAPEQEGARAAAAGRGVAGRLRLLPELGPGQAGLMAGSSW
jgi:tetratricopeptide (TPR) repeat protein